MTALFLKLLEMSLAAGWLVLVVLLLRLLLKRAPRAVVCALWALVALRLLCPFSVEAPWSLMPPVFEVTEYTAPAEPVTEAVTEPTRPAVQSPLPSVSDSRPTAVPDRSDSETPASDAPAVSVDGWAVAAFVWVGGAAVMLFYAVISTLRLKRRVCASVRLDGRVYLCDDIDTPFILGVCRPKIYLPSRLSEEERAFVLAHEQAHLRRRDHWWKPLGFLLLSVYWFHPLLWVAYILLCRDIERACDERVIRDMDSGNRAEYSSLLLRCSVPRRAVAACPLAFGEGSVKTRIRAIANYKKPTFWIALTAVLALLATGLFFLLDPMRDAPIVTSDTVPHYFAPFAKVCADGDAMGYAVADLDGDRQVELIVAETETENVTALYTWSGGQIHQLFHADTGDSYRLYEDGYMKRRTSRGSFELLRREGDELRVLDQVMHSAEYGEQTGFTAEWFRSDPEEAGPYLPITYEEAQEIEAAFDGSHTALTLSYTLCSASMTVDVSELTALTCRYTVGDSAEQTVTADMAAELYTHILSAPWGQSDAVGEDGSEPILLEFFEGEALSYGAFELFADDTLSYSGPRFLPMKWSGTVPKGTYRALSERLNVTKAPSVYDPISPTADRVARTDDWQTAGLASVGLDGVTVEPYRQGEVGRVHLLSRGGLDLDNAPYVPWAVAVETEDTVWLLPTADALTRPLGAELADVTGDGIEEVFVSWELGGQGGDGSRGVSLYCITDSGAESLFEVPKDRHGFTGETDENGFVIRNAHTGYEERFERSVMYEAPVDFEQTCTLADLRDPDGDGVYALYTENRAFLEYRANELGHGLVTWAFDGERLSATEVSFRPSREAETMMLQTPEWMLFYSLSEPTMVVRRGEDGCSLLVDTEGEDGPWRVPISESMISYYNQIDREAVYVSSDKDGVGSVVVAHDGYVDVGGMLDFSQDQADIMIRFYEDALLEALESGMAEELSVSVSEIARMWPTAEEQIARPSVAPFEVPPVQGAVTLQIPETVVSQGCFHSYTAKVTGERSLVFESPEYEQAYHVTLTNEQAAQLNARFAAVTDFSNSELISSTSDYTFRYRGITYSVSVPKDYALDLFFSELFSYCP